MGILIATSSVDMLPVMCEQELSYCCQLRDATETKMEFTEEDAGLGCTSFGKPYTYLYLMQCGTY